MRRLLAVLFVVFSLGGVAVASPAASSIAVIAPWGNAVYSFGSTDTITLTYSIAAPPNIPQTAVDAVQQAVNDWTSWLAGNAGSGQFTVTAAAAGSRANVQISIAGGGGPIVGRTSLSTDRQGFIRVQISGSSFGLANSDAMVHQIALHELGHAFVGLGHSDDSSDLMFPTIGATNIGIGACELAGFDALYSPWLTDGSNTTGPTLPGVSSASC